MAEKKSVNFNLFKIQSQTPTFDEADFGEQLLANNKFARVAIGEDSVNQFTKFEKRGNYIYGCMVHNKMSDLPFRYHQSKRTTKDLGLEEDEGLGTVTNFLFDQELQMLAYESNANGVTLSTFLHYCERTFEIPRIQADIVLNPDDFEKLLCFSVIKKFEVQIAKVEHGDLFKSKKKSITQLTNVADQTNAETVTMVLGAGLKKTKSLSFSSIVQMAKDYIGYKKTEEVTSLKVSGREFTDSKTEYIDLLESRVKFKFDIEVGRASRATKIGEIQNKIKDLYQDKKVALRKFYSKPK